ncbi:MAG: LPXTG cell wall anchor domain-containing protein [Coriobacteriales bacterium]|nr:LPXTG cell wall anchor domain-containing protein [Coriobacteriales bacterium]
MKKRHNRVWAAVLAAALMLTMLPVMAFADDGVEGAAGVVPQSAESLAPLAAPAFDAEAAASATSLQLTADTSATGHINKTSANWYSFTAPTASVTLWTNEPGELFAIYTEGGTAVAVSEVLPQPPNAPLSRTEYRYSVATGTKYCIAVAVYPEATSDYLTFGLYANLLGDASFTAAKATAQTIPFRTATTVAANSNAWYKFRAANGNTSVVGSGTIYDAQGYRINPYGAGPAGTFYATYPGATYYLYVNNTTFASRDITVTPYRQEGTNDDFDDWYEDAALARTAQGVTQAFIGDSNTTWDVWHFSFTSTNEVNDTSYDAYAWWWAEVELALVAPYQGHFSNYTVATSWGGEALDTINDTEPSAHVQALPLGDGEQLSWFHQYNSFPGFGTSVTGSVVFTYNVDIYVPSGKILVRDAEHGGVFKDGVSLPVLSAPATWTGSGPATARIDAPLDTFVQLLLDGKLVDPSNYTASEGSTIITLHPDFLKTLNSGKHTLTAVFTNGQADMLLQIDAGSSSSSSTNDASDIPQTGDSATNNASDIPQTGDSAIPALASLAMLFAASGAGLIFYRRRQLRQKAVNSKASRTA